MEFFTILLPGKLLTWLLTGGRRIRAGGTHRQAGWSTSLGRLNASYEQRSNLKTTMNPQLKQRS
jgi:hypothetical protein